MPISGIIIKCKPEKSKELELLLSAPGSVEINHVLDDGSLVAVVEAETVDAEVAIVKNLMSLDGVLDVLVAYHNFEDLVVRV